MATHPRRSFLKAAGAVAAAIGLPVGHRAARADVAPAAPVTQPPTPAKPGDPMDPVRWLQVGFYPPGTDYRMRNFGEPTYFAADVQRTGDHPNSYGNSGPRFRVQVRCHDIPSIRYGQEFIWGAYPMEAMCDPYPVRIATKDGAHAWEFDAAMCGPRIS